MALATETEARLRRLIAEKLGIEEHRIHEQARLFDDLGCDSLDMVELANRIEDTFDVQLADQELEKLVTVIDLVKLLEAKGVK